MFRTLWLIIGLTSLALGIAGVVLPLLPTTPFVLLSAYCFARSSPRLHDWLLGHKIFGPLIHNWEQHRAISQRAKVLAVLSMAVGFQYALGSTGRADRVLVMRGGSTDELGLRAVDTPLHVHDLHATILWLLGLGNMDLVYKHKGRPERPTRARPQQRPWPTAAARRGRRPPRRERPPQPGRATRRAPKERPRRAPRRAR